MRNHVIKKQVLDLKISNSAGAFNMQHLAGNFYNHALLPALEKIFDELCAEDETIQIETLEIDLGVLQINDLEKLLWNDNLQQLLKNKIREQFKKWVTEKTNLPTNSNENITRQWLFYMQQGYLNWNTIAVNEKWFNAVLESLATDFILVAALRKLINENRNALQRIVATHPPLFLFNLLRIMTAKKLQQIETVIEEIIAILFYCFNKVKGVSKNRQEINQLVWANIISLCASKEVKNMDNEKFIENCIRQNISAVILEENIDQIINNLSLTQPLIKNMLKEQVQNNKNVKEVIVIENISTATAIDEEGIFVQHAGLVLLHPFLTTFFKRLDLIEEGSFKNCDTQQKALQLLHYMATGNTVISEFELVLPKILCGWPVQQAVVFTDEISIPELAEANNLLLAVIEQWDKLKNTSIAALQQNFLQRNGKVFIKNESLFVQVEAGNLDMLLDFLPWSISIIKLPWVKEMIRVEWR